MLSSPEEVARAERERSDSTASTIFQRLRGAHRSSDRCLPVLPSRRLWLESCFCPLVFPFYLPDHFLHVMRDDSACFH